MQLQKIHYGLLVLLVISPFIIHAQDKLYKEFPLGDVKLLNGPFKHARDLNIQVLLKYDVDRLLAPYRKEAGLHCKSFKLSELGRIGWTCWRTLFISNGNELCCD